MTSRFESFPITKAHADDSRLAEHFDAVIGGIELVSGDSEVNDPVEQYERFVEQRKQRRADDDEPPTPMTRSTCARSSTGWPPQLVAAWVSIVC